MKKLILFFNLILIAILLNSCSKNSEPTPGLADSVTGKYLFAENLQIIVVFSIRRIEWSIERIATNKVRLVNKESEELFGPNPHGEIPSDPLEYVINDIEITEAGKLNFDKEVDFIQDGGDGRSRLIVEGELVGENLNVKIQQTAIESSNTTQRSITFVKQ